MDTAKVLSKGQITIPKRLREKLGVKEGDVLVLEEVEGGIVIRKGKTLLDMVGSIELEDGVSLKELVDEARERMGREGFEDRP